MKRYIIVALSTLLLGGVLLFPHQTKTEPIVVIPPPPDPQTIITNNVRGYLLEKKSPLADEVGLLVMLKHWKLLVAISAIESQYCKRQLDYNCWGIKAGEKTYRQYDSYLQAMIDANEFIERWQQKGKWLTVHSMVGSYVVPGSANWERVVNQVLGELDELSDDPPR